MDTPVLVVVLLLAVIPLVAIARRANIPYPIVLVVGGAILGFLPGLPRPVLEPRIVFSVFLPPLLYWESVTAPTKELLRTGRWIASLAIGLVIATAFAVALLTQSLIPGVPLAVALVLGAVLGPTDELAFVPMAERLRVPRRTVAVLEGESLLNDATALLLFALAVDIVQHGHASPTDALIRLVWSAVGGTAWGIGISAAALWSWRLLADQQLGSVVAILIPWLVYLPAERLHISGVLALVVAGLVVGRYGSVKIMSPRARLQVVAFWEVIVFVLNCILFFLVGIQLRPLLEGLLSQQYAPSSLAWYAIAVSLAVILVRIAWVTTETAIFRLIAKRHRDARTPAVPARVVWSRSAVVAWTGLRGAVSLAAALAIPRLAGDAPFPHRDLFIFITFAVILVTLVGQGLTLPVLIRKLGVVDDGADAREEELAHRRLTRVALDRLDTLASELPPEVVQTLRTRFSTRPTTTGPITVTTGTHSTGADGKDGASQAGKGSVSMTDRYAIIDAAFDRAEYEMLRAQRSALIDLRDRGDIDNTVMRRMLANVDLALIRFEAGESLAESGTPPDQARASV